MTSTQLVTFGKEDNIPLIEATDGKNKLNPTIKEISNYSIDKIENSFDSLTPKRKSSLHAALCRHGSRRQSIQLQAFCCVRFGSIEKIRKTN